MQFLESCWTKSDLFNYFGKLNDKNITNSSQRMATICIFEKNDINLEFVNKWLQVYYDDFSLVDDTPSKLPNFDWFIENRHDQSVFSILSKIYDIYAIYSGECDIYIKHFPIIGLRDKKKIIDNDIQKSINKIVWWMPIRKNRDEIRKMYYDYCSNILLDLIYNKRTNDKIYNPIDFIIKLYLRNKINTFIKSNKEIKNFINEMQNINLI